jgi:hypothetical protein
LSLPFFLAPAVDWRALELYNSWRRGPGMFLNFEGQEVRMSIEKCHFLSHVMKCSLFLELEAALISSLGRIWIASSSSWVAIYAKSLHSSTVGAIGPPTFTLSSKQNFHFWEERSFSSMEQRSVSPTRPHRMTAFISTNTRLMPSVASLSRDLQCASSFPLLVHSLHETRSSVLSLAANENYIFSGSQNRDIAVRPTLGVVQECLKLTM